MAFLQTFRPQGGGSGPTETLRPAQDLFAQTDAWADGDLYLTLSHTPVNDASIFIMSEVQPLYPDDFEVLTGPDRIRILNGRDPAADTDDGIWNFSVQYWYIV